ncbi:MAG TPA: cyanophycin synthetase, partial [Spirochaetota bacterium]|nr:cyanophycin synthetase [Spirochaetota bacterium]
SDATGDRIVVVNDTYNSNPLSLRYALRSLAEIYPSRRRIAILADMKELGESGPALHRAAGAEVGQYGFSMLFTFGELAADIAEGARGAGMDAGSVRHFSSKEDLIHTVMSTMTDGDALLVKGSRSMKMEEVADALVRE